MVDEIKDMEKYAEIHHVPIMQKEGIEFLLEFIKTHNIRKILEIGTAIGYSSSRMALVNSNIEITTIERDNDRYLEAVNNINKLGLDKQITLIFKDALEVNLDDKYNLIFIDAAKSQYIKFFEKYKNNLQENGYIITDNMHFHGMVFKEENEIESRNVRGLVRKIKEYKTFLENNDEFTTKFLDLGDGIAISKRKENHYE